jgi:hypothetical protein
MIEDGDSFDYYNEADSTELRDLAKSIFAQKPEIFKQIQQYVENTYANEIENSDNDYSSDGDDTFRIDFYSDVFNLLDEQNDDIIFQLQQSYNAGNETGASNNLYKAVEEWADDPFDDQHINVTRSDDSILVSMELPEFMMQYFEHMDTIEYYGWSGYIDMNNIDEPYNGWEEFDEDAAIEYFSETFNIPDEN